MRVTKQEAARPDGTQKQQPYLKPRVWSAGYVRTRTRGAGHMYVEPTGWSKLNH